MDLSELKPVAPAPDRHGQSGLDHESAQVDPGWNAVAQVGSEVAVSLTAALDRVTRLQATGAIDRQGLQALIDDVRQARRAGFVAQQLARLARGGIQQQHEAVGLIPVLSDVLAQCESELAAHGLAVRKSLKPAEVVVDASLLSAFLQSVLDWAGRHARTHVDLRIEAKGWPEVARFSCRFGHVPADQADQAVATTTSTAPSDMIHIESLDCLWWRLVQQLAATMQLPLARTDTAATTQLTVEFPHTTNETLEGATSFEIDTGFALSGDSRPLMGSHVLVIAARRDVRNQVRQAVAHMGLMLDFVTSIESALESCQQGLPHAIIYEAMLGDSTFERMRRDMAKSGRSTAWIEISEQGEAFEVSSFGGVSMARVGRDAIATSLPTALMFELAKAD
jgi:hypothetical protein